jgi:hypothetical protein
MAGLLSYCRDLELGGDEPEARVGHYTSEWSGLMSPAEVAAD